MLDNQYQLIILKEMIQSIMQWQLIYRTFHTAFIVGGAANFTVDAVKQQGFDI